MDTETHQVFDETLLKLTNKFPNQLNYYFFKQAFSKDECSRIIDSFSPKCVNAATVFGNNYSETRRTSVTWIPKNPSTQWIYDKLVEMASEANEAMFGFKITNLIDQIQFASYDESVKGTFANHVDMGAEDRYSCRKLSMSVQLSDPVDYEGGDFVITNNKWPPKEQGNVILFPSFLEHRVDPVTKGRRYSLVLWFYGPPYM